MVVLILILLTGMLVLVVEVLVVLAHKLLIVLFLKKVVMVDLVFNYLPHLEILYKRLVLLDQPVDLLVLYLVDLILLVIIGSAVVVVEQVVLVLSLGEYLSLVVVVDLVLHMERSSQCLLLDGLVAVVV